ncbi:3-phosphoserine/phosphohydroxythreonine transaminase [Rhizosphaericola mali]|uniref:Phosphoserine aminotransferase n=1 Tax=Rhizosphaericola mali TaxID=2545455 RepID=A0A5P2G7M1_9BACT|nr:3-phosphoserine/phosphohydroxythreonine transaminase [Rhizosphaericola mali]QES89932.1 3-phosphoserine/phosphohydroxythreonine transaminase [Rhizosphaericola mali]
MKKYNFNSGPSILPQEVLDQAAAAVHDFNGIGLSILEIGHRTNWFVDTINEARSLVKELMGLGDDYEVIYLQGGGTTQFMQVPMNLLDNDATAAYINNGIWGRKAIQEAKYFGNVNVVSNTEDKNNSYIQKDFTVPADAPYLHFTGNNTVEGTEWFTEPISNGVPLIADMSSNIFSRPMNFDKYDMIYAGAQKNIGSAGVTIVVVKKELLGKIKRPIPPIMDYREHIKAESLLNTPPVFSILVSLLTLKWIKKEGGLEEMEKRAVARSTKFYNYLDESNLFRPLVVKEDRSRMNATFTIDDKTLENAFLDECKANGMVGVKGHRSVGGLRVSMYNALPMEDLEALISLMKNFEAQKG